jgi:heme/copper-type cytochrome/quinol oxidase subunit 3
MLLLIAILCLVLVDLIFSYGYLVPGEPSWMVPGVQLRGLGLASLSGIVLVLGAAAMGIAARALRRGETARARAALAGCLVSGVLFLGARVVDQASLPFGADTSAYGAIFHTIAGVHAALMVVGLAMHVAAQAQAWAGGVTASHPAVMENTAIFWYFLALAWVAIFATLYLWPYIAAAT